MDVNYDASIVNASKKRSIFVRNFELWIDELISRDGLADKDLIIMIKERFERSVAANIQHHRLMADNSKENGDEIAANRHRLMGDVYKSLFATKATA